VERDLYRNLNLMHLCETWSSSYYRTGSTIIAAEASWRLHLLYDHYSKTCLCWPPSFSIKSRL